MAIASLVEDESKTDRLLRLVYFGWLSEYSINLFLGGVLEHAASSGSIGARALRVWRWKWNYFIDFNFSDVAACAVVCMNADVGNSVARTIGSFGSKEFYMSNTNDYSGFA